MGVEQLGISASTPLPSPPPARGRGCSYCNLWRNQNNQEQTHTEILKGASKNSEFAQMQGTKKISQCAYGVYLIKKFFS